MRAPTKRILLTAAIVLLARTWRHAMTKITKSLLVALALAGASITFVANASAAPTQGPSQAEQNWLSRASQPDSERNAFGY
jgi:hypothetical protein